LYGSRSVRLQDLDFDENNSKWYKVKERKDRYVPLSFNLIGIKKYAPKNQDYLLMVSHSAIWR
jgi:hypothetical protein